MLQKPKHVGLASLTALDEHEAREVYELILRIGIDAASTMLGLSTITVRRAACHEPMTQAVRQVVRASLGKLRAA